MPVKRTQFKQKIHLVLALLGIIPYLLTTYVFIQANMTLTESISLMCAMVLLFHLAGFHILQTFAADLLDLARSSAFTQRPGGRYPALIIAKHNTAEVFDIRNNFNALLTELDEGRKKFDTVTVELLRESRKGFIEYERRLAELSPYVDPKIVSKIMDNSSGHSHGLRGEHRRVAVLFVDICSFTKSSEKMSPEAVVALLNEFFDVAVQIIYRHNGVVDKFIGDAVMAVFGLSAPLYQVSVDAVSTALDLQTATYHLMKKWQREGRAAFHIRVGINTGEVVAGNIGSRDRMDYTVIGDAVNVASRMVDHAAPDEVLISATTYNNSKSYFHVQSKGCIHVKNRDEPVDCYTVTAKKAQAFHQHTSFDGSERMSLPPN